MCHNHCAVGLAKKGASNQTLSKVAAFLRDRTMQIRQGIKLSSERPTPGGAPQGTKSGNLLFSISTDHIGEQEIEKQAVVRTIPAGVDGPRDLEGSFNVNYCDTRSRKGTRRVEDTMVEEEWECHEIEAVLGIESSLHRMKNFKYVDDLTVLEVNSLRLACGTISTEKEVKRICAQGLQLQLREIGGQALEIGMMLHPRKTQLICISLAINSEVSCYLKNGEERLESDGHLKILGYHLATRPNTDAQVRHIKSSFNQSSWLIRHLKLARIKPKMMTTVYCSMIRSAIEYSSVVHGGFLTQEQSDELERLQSTCLKIIWGWRYSYRQVLKLAGLQTLEKRWTDAFKKFTLKAFQNKRFKDRWFPLREPD